MQKDILHDRYDFTEDDKAIIDITLESLSDLFNSFDRKTSFYKRELDQDFEDYLIVKLDSWFVTLVDWLDYGWHWQAIIWLDTMWTDDIYDDVLIMADSLDDTDHNQDWYYITPFARFFYMREEASFTETKYKQPFITIFPK